MGKGEDGGMGNLVVSTKEEVYMRGVENKPPGTWEESWGGMLQRPLCV